MRVDEIVEHCSKNPEEAREIIGKLDLSVGLIVMLLWIVHIEKRLQEVSSK